MKTQIGFEVVFFTFQCCLRLLDAKGFSSAFAAGFLALVRVCSVTARRGSVQTISYQTKVTIQQCGMLYAQTSNDKWMFSFCGTCRGRRSCCTGCSRCLRLPGWLLVNLDQTNNRLWLFGRPYENFIKLTTINSHICRPGQSPQLLGQLVEMCDW